MVSFVQNILFDLIRNSQVHWDNISLYWNNIEVYHYIKIMINKEDNYQNMPFRNDRHIYGSCKNQNDKFQLHILRVFELSNGKRYYSLH